MEKFVSVKKLRKVVGRLLSSNGSVSDFKEVTELVNGSADWTKLMGDKQVVVEFETPIDPPFKFKRHTVNWSAAEILKALETKKAEWAVTFKKGISSAKAVATRRANQSPERTHQIAVRKEFNKQLTRISYAELNWKDFNLREYAFRWAQAGKLESDAAEMLELAIVKAITRLEKLDQMINQINELIKIEHDQLTERQWNQYVTVVSDKLKNAYDRLLKVIENACAKYHLPIDFAKVTLLKSAFLSGLKKVEKVGHVKFLESLK